MGARNLVKFIISFPLLGGPLTEVCDDFEGMKHFNQTPYFTFMRRTVHETPLKVEIDS